MSDNTDHALDPGPSWLDDMLRAALTHLPDDAGISEAPPAAMLDEIDRAIDTGWADGYPPTLDELAADHADTPAHDQPWSGQDNATQHWDHDAGEQAFHPHQAHDWHHHLDHSTDIDPDPGSHL